MRTGLVDHTVKHTGLGSGGVRRLLAVVALTALVGVGCQSYNDKRGGDSPVGPTDRSPSKILFFPDRFQNVSFKCNGRVGVYSTTRNASPVVINNDPNCESK